MVGRIRHPLDEASPTLPRTRRRRLGLTSRTAVAFTCGVTALIGVFALSAYERIKTDALRERERVAVRQTFANARIARSRLRAEQPDPGSLVSSLVSPLGTPLLLVEGEWFTSTVGVERDDIPAGVIDAVLNDGAARQRIEIDSELVLVVGVALPSVDAGYFEFVELSALEQTLTSTRTSLLIAGLLASALAAVLAIVVSRLTLRPIRMIAEVASDVSRGSLTARVEPTGMPDLDPVVIAFNDMVTELRDRIERDARFAGDVTHELRGPLAALSAASSRARRHVDDPERVLESLDALDASVSRFNRLVVDLLEISRLEAGAAELVGEAVNIGELVHAVLAETSDSPEVAVTDRVPDLVVADKRRLRQCIKNLVDNAARYAGGATAIIVDVPEGHEAIEISVDDAGPGVPQHERSRIFERFARGGATAIDGSGTGLGLALVAEHARLHGGSIHVTESPAGGARFVLRIPIRVPR